MRSFINYFGGQASQWLLARPSQSLVGQTNLRIATLICAFIVIVFLAFSLTQWSIAERIYFLQSSKDTEMLTHLEGTLAMGNKLSNAHRATLNALLARDNREFSDSLAKLDSNLKGYVSLLENMQFPPSSTLALKKQELSNFAEQYRVISTSTLSLAKQNKMQAAIAMRITSLRPIYNDWETKQIQFGYDINTQSSIKQADYAREIALSRIFLLLFLIIPAIFIFISAISIIGILGFQLLRKKTINETDAWGR